jgi:hypothetical protein
LIANIFIDILDLFLQNMLNQCLHTAKETMNPIPPIVITPPGAPEKPPLEINVPFGWVE